MQKTLFLSILIVAVALVSCGKKSQTDDMDYYDEELVTQVYADEPYSATEQVTVDGRTYTCEMTRTASDSLPMVVDEETKYKDNVVKISVSCGGTQLFSRSFTKATLAPYVQHVPESDLQQSTLSGVSFLCFESGAGLKFHLVLSSPLSDMIVPFDVVVSHTTPGYCSIRMGEDIDLQTETEE